MNEQSQIIKLCGICGFKRDYNENHRLYNACEECAALRYAKHYQANREKTKTNIYQQNKEEKLTRNSKTVNSYRNDIKTPKNKIEDLIITFEMLKIRKSAVWFI